MRRIQVVKIKIGLAGLLLLNTFCNQQQTPKISADLDACAHCNMVINKVNEACGFYQNSEFVTFDSPACLLKQLDEQKVVPEKMYFADFISGNLLQVDSTIFLLTEYIPTVMNGKVICFSKKTDALQYKKHKDEIISDWTGYRVYRAMPDKILKVTLSSTNMTPEVFSVFKGDIIELNFTGIDLKNDERLIIKHYESYSDIKVLATGEPSSYRLLADKPGDGFAFVRESDGKVVGMLKVAGAHTADEEAM